MLFSSTGSNEAAESPNVLACQASQGDSGCSAAAVLQPLQSDSRGQTSKLEFCLKDNERRKEVKAKEEVDCQLEK